MSNITEASQQIYPLLPVRDAVVFPTTEGVLIVGRDRSMAAVMEANKRDKKIILSLQKKTTLSDPTVSDVYSIGVLASIETVTPMGKNEAQILVKGIEKVHILSVVNENPFYEVAVTPVVEPKEEDEETGALVKLIATEVKKAINFGKSVDVNFLMNVFNITSSYNFSYQVAVVVDMKLPERQALLEENDMKRRLKLLLGLITREVKSLELEHSLASKASEHFEKQMKENVLREKMRTIEKELGGDEDFKNNKDLRDKIKKAGMPEEVEQKALKELKRLDQMSQFNPENSALRTYIETVVELPWKMEGTEEVNIGRADEVLEEDHYGLKKVKERILEYLAVMHLKRLKEKNDAEEMAKNQSATPLKNAARQPNILCFVGPPGVGKTSLGKSIARALDRKFVKVSLGGVRDEAEIRGHRRTYVGSMPGRFIRGMKQAGVVNPVFMLDEIDKLGNDYRGDPSSALLEALDPEQNHAFEDHYLELPYDLSQVFFITTANYLDNIPPALRDRLEIISFPGYTEEEKFQIAKKYIVSKQLEAHALSESQATISDSAIYEMIRKYTREAGVRELERQIATVFRKVARQVVEGKMESKKVTEDDLHSLLGARKYSSQLMETRDTCGISTGLAWTQVGGEILFVEVSIMPGKGGVTLTGNLGEVMKESAQAAVSYIRAHHETFALPKDFFHKSDVHIHVPEGATPKDGPSAGVAIVSALVSALTQVPVRYDVAMTGEITLRGRVTEIGGVKEKVIAAHRAGIKTVILPSENQKDLEEIPENVKKDIKFEFAHEINDALKIALTGKQEKLTFTPLIKSKKKEA